LTLLASFFYAVASYYNCSSELPAVPMIMLSQKYTLSFIILNG